VTAASRRRKLDRAAKRKRPENPPAERIGEPLTPAKKPEPPRT
jgi:hypothetical protein